MQLCNIGYASTQGMRLASIVVVAALVVVVAIMCLGVYTAAVNMGNDPKRTSLPCRPPEKTTQVAQSTHRTADILSCAMAARHHQPPSNMST